jgi:hypothetical protein
LTPYSEPNLPSTTITIYPQKLTLISPTSSGRSVGIFRLRTQATEFVFCLFCSTGPLLLLKLKEDNETSGYGMKSVVQNLLNTICRSVYGKYDSE